MPDLLLELRSEEIPARMQRKAAGDLKKMVTDGLVEAGLTYEAATEYWTPRRLTLDIRGLNARSKDVREEIKGPSTKAPDQAIQGFLRKAGLTDVLQAHTHSDPKKGDFYVAHLVKPGRAAEEIIAEIVPAVVRAFPWPKSMRWGAASARPGSMRWVRPLQSIICTFGPETEEPVVVDFEIDGIRAGNVTYGHRFHAPDAITVRRFDDYVSKLEAAKVVLDAERRKRIILDDAKNLAFASGLELVEDEGLLEEVSGLVEWPVVLMGEFEQDYLAIPPEVIRLTIRANQKCFVVRPLADPSSDHASRGHLLPQGETEGRGIAADVPSPLVGEGGSARSAETGEGYRLANRFILTANIEASDGGAEIVHGNGKVVRARLSDAVHFWKTDQADLPDLKELTASGEKFGLDLAKPLDQRMARLDHLGVTFHAKLGTQGERVARIAKLARELAPLVGADPDLAARAAVLAKADLTTEIVGEFPELQGAMGRKYAVLQGENASVAAAIEDHYKPQGPSDNVPTDPVAIAVALADKLDTLVGFWAIDEKPTGSKDPYALRRAALGVIRIVVENGFGLKVSNPVASSFDELAIQAWRAERLSSLDDGIPVSYPLRVPVGESDWDHAPTPEIDLDTHYNIEPLFVDGKPHYEGVSPLESGLNEAWFPKLQTKRQVSAELLSFFHDRLKVYMRDKGARHDLIDAVLSTGSRAISPLAGEMSAQPTEGGAVPHSSPRVDDGRSTLPPSALPGISPAGGEITPASTNDDLLLIVSRVAALGIFLDSEDGKNLLAGTKRAANILAAEEKKGTAIAAAVDPTLFKQQQEEKLLEAVNQAERNAAQAIHDQDFSAAMLALSVLREPVDSFFEAVLVNDEDQAVRANRLALLARIRAATGAVADFSKIAG